MFNISSCIDILRAGPHAAKPFLGHFVGPELAKVTVSTTPAYRAWNLPISVTSGSMTNVRHGFLLEVRSSTGGFKGYWNIRFAGTISTSNLPIRELSRADIDVKAGDVITVRAYVPLVDKLPAADVTFAPDQLPWAGQTETLPPIACSGGHLFTWLPDGASTMPFTLYGGQSYTTDSGSGGTFTHQYAIIAGVATLDPGSNATDTDPVYNSGAGETTIMHTVTDASNSVVWRQYVYIRIYSPEDPPIDCVPGELAGTDRDGWNVPVTVYQEVPRSLLADGALVCLFVRQWYNGVEQSFGDRADRAHMKMVGYANQDSITLSPEGELTFSLISPMARMMSLPGFSKALANALTAIDWQTIEMMTLFLVWMHIGRWFTSMTENFDFRVTDSSGNALYPKLYVPKATPAEQLIDLAESRNARFICKRRGEFQIHTAPPYMELSARASANIHHLSNEDYLIDESDVPTITRDHFKKVQLLKLTGISAGLSGNVSVYSDYPGKATGRGNQNATYDKAIVNQVNPQGHANIVNGLRGAFMDMTYNNPTLDISEKAYEWKLPLPGGYDVLDFDQGFIACDDYIPNLRGIDVTALNHWIKGITVSWDEQGAEKVVYSLVAETYAPPAETGDAPPEVTLPPYTPIDYVPTPYVPVTPGSRIPANSGQLPINGWMLDSDGPYASKIVGLDPVLLTFTHVDISTGLGAGFGIAGYSHPFNYKHAYAVMSDGIYDTPDIDNFSSWAMKRNNAALFGNSSYVAHQAGSSHLRNGWHFAVSGPNAIAVTFDDWQTSTLVGINGAAAPNNSIGANDLAYVWINGHVKDVLYAIARAHGSTHAGFFVSTDGGLTWTLHSDPIHSTAWDTDYGDVSRQYIEIPYKRDGGAANVHDAGMEAYWYAVGDVHSGQAGRMGRTKDRFTTLNTTTAWAVGDDNTSALHPLTTFTHDSDYIWFLGGTQGAQVFRSVDGLVNVSPALFGFGAAAWTCSINGWSMNPDAAIAWTRAGGGGSVVIRATVDGGITWFGSIPPHWPANHGCAYAEFSLWPFIGPA